MDLANQTFSDYPAFERPAAARIFEEQAVAGYTNKLTWPGYTNVSSTYINTLQDQVVPPAQQQGYINTLEEYSPSLSVKQIDSGHVPMYTQLDKYMEVVESILSEL